MNSPLDAPPPQVDGKVTPSETPAIPRGVSDTLDVRAVHDTALALVDETAAQRNDVITALQRQKDVARAQADAMRLDEQSAAPVNAQAESLANENRVTMVDIGITLLFTVPLALGATWLVIKFGQSEGTDRHAA